MPEGRQPQLAYSDMQALMLDEPSRRAKADKAAAVIKHFLGRDDLAGTTILDVGCSGGIVADQLHSHGAHVIGLDIDVPGLAKAQDRYGGTVAFVCANSERMPLADASVDVIICNHVYEHVVTPKLLFDELRRVVRPDGMLYLGLANRLGVIEPHYRLPFLSWLPRALAHRYVQMSGRATHYHERLATWWQLKALATGLTVWDYTTSVLMEPAAFAAGDVVPSWATRMPPRLVLAARSMIPTYIWVATTTGSHPQGAPLRAAPQLIPTRPADVH